MEPTLEQVRRELADIHDELLALSEDNFTRRSQLKERQNELRQLSHQLLEGEPLHNAETLRAAFNRLQEVRDRLLEKRLSMGTATSIGDAGIDADFTALVNRAIESGIGIDEVEERMKEILEQMRSSS